MQIKVLFAAQHDPYSLDKASGSDFHYLRAAQNNGFEVKVIGPFDTPPIWPERILARACRRTGRRYLKYDLTKMVQASQATNRMASEWKPDVVFTHFPSPLVFYRGRIPCVYRTDSTFHGLDSQYPLYGKLILNLQIWQEKRTFAHSAAVITHSEWSRKVLMDYYKVPDKKIVVWPEPSTLPASVVPERVPVMEWKHLQEPLRLLLVGRDYHRKGIDIAIEIVHRLNAAGVRAELTVCGVKREADQYVRFVGPYKKSLQEELEKYVDLYRTAHLLLHPARFEAGAIVVGEAAAFGTPTITNDTGGMGTTVEDGISGIVLPIGSAPYAYVEAIVSLIHNPERYYNLCQTARARYEQELTWEIVDKKFGQVLCRVVDACGKERG